MQRSSLAPSHTMCEMNKTSSQVNFSIADPATKLVEEQMFELMNKYTLGKLIPINWWKSSSLT